MNKLTLFLVALVSIHLNNAMNDKEPIELEFTIIGAEGPVDGKKIVELEFDILDTKHGQIIKLDRRNLPSEFSSQLIEYRYRSHVENIPTIYMRHYIKQQRYEGAIEKIPGEKFIEMQNQTKLKTIIEQFEAQFDATPNNTETKFKE